MTQTLSNPRSVFARPRCETLSNSRSLVETLGGRVVLVSRQEEVVVRIFSGSSYSSARRSQRSGFSEAWLRCPMSKKQEPLSRPPDKGQTRHWRIGDRDLPGQVASQQSLPPFLSAGKLHQNLTILSNHWTSEPCLRKSIPHSARA